MTSRFFVIGWIALAGFSAAGCQLHPRVTEAAVEFPAPPPGPPLPYQISEMRIQTEPATTFIYQPLRTNFDQLSLPASRAIAGLKHFADHGQLQPTGPALFIYHDPSEDPSETFDVEMGLPATDKSPLPPGLSKRSLPRFRCASMTYRGPFNLLPRAYDKLIRLMIAANLVPSDETRESYLTWESAESSNNVIKIEVGIR